MPSPVVLAAAGGGRGFPLGLEDMWSQAGLCWNKPPGLTVKQGEHSHLLLKCNCPLLHSLAAKTQCLQWYLGGTSCFMALLLPLLFFTMPALSWVPGLSRGPKQVWGCGLR